MTGPAATAATPPTVTEATVAGDAVYTIDFKRDVSKCAYTANQVGSASVQAPGVAPVQNQPNQIAVNLGDDGATPTPAPARGSFHVQVIC